MREPNAAEGSENWPLILPMPRLQCSSTLQIKDTETIPAEPTVFNLRIICSHFACLRNQKKEERAGISDAPKKSVKLMNSIRQGGDKK